MLSNYYSTGECGKAGIIEQREWLMLFVTAVSFIYNVGFDPDLAVVFFFFKINKKFFKILDLFKLLFIL